MKFLIGKSSKIEKKFKKYNNKKLLIITGKKSYYKSGAQDLIKFIKTKNLEFYFKQSSIPELNELKEMILKTKTINLQDLFF